MAQAKKIMRDIQSRFGALPDIKADAQRTIRKLRKYPFETEFEILKTLKPKGRCAIDVGANRGQSIDALRLYHSTVQVHAFEPNKPLFAKLEARFQADRNLIIYNEGLGEEVLSATLHVPYYRNFMYDGLSSFAKQRAENWLNAESVWRFNPDLLRVESHPCKIDVLDKYVLEPFFLKIHVQGFEAEVLKGAQQTIRSHVPVLLMANNKDADVWLRKEGWTQHAYTDGKLIQMEANDMSLYNCIYLHPQSQEHQDIMKDLY